MPPSIAIIGPGALGCLLACGLDGSLPVQIIDHDAERAQRLTATGIILEREGRTEVHRLPVVVPTEAAAADFVFLAVKSPAVSRALADNRALVEGARALVCLQNGIGHLDHLAPYADRALLCVTSVGANCRRPGHVVHAGQGPTVIGPLDASASPVAAEIAAVLDKAGFPTRVSDNIMVDVWKKLLVNVGINALTGILDCANGELLANSWALATMKAAIEEATQVARAAGIPVGDDGFVRAQAVCRATAANISSLLQDIRNRRPTEIEAINGAVVALAARHAIAVPTNRMLTEKIRAIEAGYGKSP